MSNIFEQFASERIYTYEEVSSMDDFDGETLLDIVEYSPLKKQADIKISISPVDNNTPTRRIGRKRVSLEEAETRMRNMRDTIFYISEWNGTTKPCKLTCGRCGHTIELKNGNNVWSSNNKYFIFPICEVCYNEGINVASIFSNILKERNFKDIINNVLDKLKNGEIAFNVEYPSKDFVLSFINTYNYDAFEGSILDTLFVYSKIKTSPNKYILHSLNDGFEAIIDSIDRTSTEKYLQSIDTNCKYLVECSDDEFYAIAHREINKCAYNETLRLFNNIPHSLIIY